MTKSARTSRVMPGLALLAATILGFGLVGEIGLRVFAGAALLSGARHWPEANQRYYEREFLLRYRYAPPKKWAWDPDLGWEDDKSTERVRPPWVPGAKTAARKVLVIGDSFAAAFEVDPSQAFYTLLDRRFPDVEFLSMGVGGYGIDQAVLKFDLFGRQHHPDLVIFAVHPADLERATVSFFTSAKPTYRLDDQGQLVLESRPVPPPDEVAAGLGHKEWTRLLLWDFIRARFAGLAWKFDVLRRPYFDDARHLALALFRRQATLAAAEGAEVLIVQIPALHVYANAGYYRSAPYEEESVLRAVYRDVGLPWIDLADLWTADQAERHYLRRPDGSGGHLSAEGNIALAKVLADALCHGLAIQGDLRFRLECR
jgi:hypothetical protein